MDQELKELMEKLRESGALEEFRKSIETARSKIVNPAKEVSSMLSSHDLSDRLDIAVEIGKMVHSLNYSDELDSFDNCVIDSIYDGHVIKYTEKFFERLMFVKENIENDLYDYSFDIVHIDDSVEVFTVYNGKTSREVDTWIIIYDKIKSMVHVRIIYDEEYTDYPNSDYPNRLSLNFYKDRNWVCGYVEKFHGANLGGVYGDIRDKGYVISFPTKDNVVYNSNLPDRNILFINDQRHFMSTFNQIHYMLNNG